MKKNRSAFEIAYERFIQGNPAMESMLDEERQRLELAARLRDIREHAGLSQAELAKRAGTTAAVISKLEDPDYDGHSLRTLRKIGSALGMRLQVTLVGAAATKSKSKRPVAAVGQSHKKLSGV